MFGREYANHIETLTYSLGEINQSYQEKLKTKNSSLFMEKLKKIYVLLFGIAEIGFQIRSMYFEKILKANVSEKSQKRILDAGCGIGAYTFYLAKMFKKAKVIGGDIDKQKLKACRSMAGEFGFKNATFTYFDTTKKSKKSNLDLIVCIDVLEHIKFYNEALENFSKLLKKNGHLYIHVPQPNQKRIFSTLKSWYHEDHAHEGISKKTIENDLKKLGLTIIESKETFGFFGKLSWELNHITLSKSFVLAGLTFPFLYILAKLDLVGENTNGLGVAILAKK